jgi:hypothetical protein
MSRPVASVLQRILRFARSNPREFITVLLVLAVALGAALILGPHLDNKAYNNIIPSGSE